MLVYYDRVVWSLLECFQFVCRESFRVNQPLKALFHSDFGGVTLSEAEGRREDSQHPPVLLYETHSVIKKHFSPHQLQNDVKMLVMVMFNHTRG